VVYVETHAALDHRERRDRVGQKSAGIERAGRAGRFTLPALPLYRGSLGLPPGMKRN